MMNTTFLRKLTVVLVAIFFASCDKDYNTLGSDIVGNDDFTIAPELFTVKAYNQEMPGVQTNNMSFNQLGIFVNPNTVLGKTTTNFVTQLSLGTLKPVFKNKYSIQMDSVVLTVPYFSTKTGTDANGRGTYVLNSIYTTNTTANNYDPIDLKVYRNGFYLRESDPVTLETQKHYSDEDAKFSSNTASPKLNDKPVVSENTAFVPDTKEYVKYKVENNEVVEPKVVDSRSSPRMRLHLDEDYFYNNIIRASAADLDNDNAFKSYFKGLYFQVSESIAGKGTSMALDFAEGNITIYYKQDKVDVPGSTSTTPSTDREMASLTLNMKGNNTVNLFKNEGVGQAYTDAMVNSNPQTEDKNLYLKGGQGSMAFLELFTSDELTILKSKKVLVNEASLTFTVDKTAMTSDSYKPQRIYIFDADNNTPLYDYYLDGSTNANDASLNKSLHGGILETVATGSVTKEKYKIRITEHINNILRETTGITKNVRLGVVVTGNINIISNGFLKGGDVDAPSTILTAPTKKMNRTPFSSTISPLGTVLYGSNYLPTDANYDDRIKFEIYYTKPN